MDDLSTREADATFAELICADPQWLDDEFNALVSASFGVTPPWPRLPAPPRVPPRLPPARWPGRGRPVTSRAIRVGCTRARGPRRQRSPPGG